MSYGFSSLMPADGPFKQALRDAVFSFTPRPAPIAGDLRMSWGISILLLSLFYSRGKRASFQKLQFLAHTVRLREGREDVRAMLKGDINTSDVSARVEPWLNRAVNYAHALGMLEIARGRTVTLSEKGKKTAQQLSERQDIFGEERTFLSEVAPKMTEQLISKIWRMESLQ